MSTSQPAVLEGVTFWTETIGLTPSLLLVSLGCIGAFNSILHAVY